jgi:hypothetical protein
MSAESVGTNRARWRLYDTPAIVQNEHYPLEAHVRCRKPAVHQRDGLPYRR